MQPQKSYVLSIDYKKLTDAAGNSGDTIYTSKISTLNELEFSGLSGDVEIHDSSNIMLEIRNLNLKDVIYRTKLNTENKYEFPRVRPGKYTLYSFIDGNSNGMYDNGSILHFAYSERFISYPDTLNLSARWPVGDVKLYYDKHQ